MSLAGTRGGFRLDVHVLPDEGNGGFADAVALGLTSQPKVLPPTYFYDARGSELFEQITELPEYYQTRTERALLEELAPELATLELSELVELGAGSARKTEVLIAELSATAPLRYVAFDVDPHTLLDTCSRVAARYPDVALHGVAGDFGSDLGAIPPAAGRRLVAFLGGTIGNLLPEERAPFLTGLAELTDRGDLLLIGTDLAGDAARIEPAYDDAQGVTAEFNLNLLRRINDELGADFDVTGFAHVARYVPEQRWIEMHLRSLRDQVVEIPSLSVTAQFAADEEMQTEISCKFTRDEVEEMYAAAGFALRRWFADARGWYALSLAEKT